MVVARAAAPQVNAAAMAATFNELEKDVCIHIIPNDARRTKMLLSNCIWHGAGFLLINSDIQIWDH